MVKSRSFNQIVQETYRKILVEFLISLLFFYILPMLTVGYSNLTAKNISFVTIFFSALSGIYIAFILTAVIMRNISRLLNIIKREMNNVYQQSQWLDENEEIVPLTMTEFIETKNSIQLMQKRIRNMLIEEQKQKKELMLRVSAAAHDLKTPLTVIQGNAEFLQSVKMNDISQQSVEDIYVASQKLDNYFDQLIDYSKTFYDDKSYWQSITVSSLIELLQQEFSYIVRKKGRLDINYLGTSNDSSVYLQLHLFKRAMLNLITNALHHSQSPHPTIKFNIEIYESKLNLSIWNSGSQFSQDILNYSGEEFYHIEDLKTASTTHHGIGLAFIKRVILLHQGTFNLSNRNDGALAKITLPIIQNIECSKI